MGRLVVFSNPSEGREAEYSQWYLETHIPEVLALAPFTAAQRFRTADAQIGEVSTQFAAIYEYEGSSADAVEALKGAFATFDMSEKGGPGGSLIFLDEASDRITE